MRASGRAGSWGLALSGCLAVLALVGGASAEERTIEALGVNGFTPPKSLAAERQAAVTEGIRAAVYRVVAEALPALDEEAAATVARRLFRARARDYVTRFRVLEDRGVEEKRLSSNRKASHEYVVRIEATVDARQVRQRLRTAGLLAAEDGALRRIELTLVELPSYAALEAIRTALVDQLQAQAATPVEFTPGRAVLAVTARGDGRSLLDRLVALQLGPWRLEPREAGSDRATAAVRAR